MSAAREEYADTVAVAVGSGLESGDDLADDYDFETEDLKCPNVAEIKALRAAREIAKGLGDFVEVELSRCTYTPSADDEGCRESNTKIVRNELLVTVSGLPGADVIRGFVLPK